VRSVARFVSIGPLSASAVNDSYWTANGTTLGGSGTWNSSSNRWSPSDTTVSGGQWANGRAAYFGGTSGTVTVGSDVAPLAMNFTTSGYRVASGSGSITACDVSVVAGGSATIAARLTGTSGLALGGGTLLLAGTANNYTGFTNVVGGTLQLAANNVIPDASRVAVSRFMLADFNGYSDTVGGLQGLGSVRMGPTVTVNITGATDARLDGFLSGTGDLVIDSDGSGVQRLNTSAQSLNVDFAVKDYVGKTTVKRGALGVDRSAVPLNTTEVTIEAAGRLALSPNSAAPDQVFTFGSNPALPVTLAGGTIGQGAGDDVELANVLAVSGTATVQIVNKNNPDPLVPSTQQFTFSGPLTGSGVLRVLASDTTSGLAQSRAKFTSTSGNTFAGTVSPGPFAVARFNGDFTQTSVALAGGKVDGYGAIRTVSGTGIVSPDGTSGAGGIFTVGTISGSAGTGFNFDLNAAQDAGMRTAFVRRPDEWGPAGPPDPNPNRAYDFIEDGFDGLCERVLAAL
jgi:fibronectin-binding autotransporter adhesin